MSCNTDSRIHTESRINNNGKYVLFTKYLLFVWLGLRIRADSLTAQSDQTGPQKSTKAAGQTRQSPLGVRPKAKSFLVKDLKQVRRRLGDVFYYRSAPPRLRGSLLRIANAENSVRRNQQMRSVKQARWNSRETF